MFGYSFVRAGQNKELMAAIMDQMQAFDVEIEGLHTETGPGVLEAALRARQGGEEPLDAPAGHGVQLRPRIMPLLPLPSS